MASFVTLTAGWALDLRRHTVTEVIRAAGAVGRKHISSYHRFFSRARWTTGAVGLTLAALLIERLAPKAVIRLVVGDTLGCHTGKRISGASKHRDALWYVAAGSEVVRLIVVRDFRGHEKDDVFVSMDPTLPPRHIIDRSPNAGRWK